MLKYIPKKKIILLSGDFFIIVTTTILAVYLRTGRFVNVPVLYTGATCIVTFCYLLIFYIADLYNLDYKIKTTQYLARVLGAVIAGAVLVAGAFYTILRPTRIWLKSRVPLEMVMQRKGSWRF
jgi:hypothetical protein